MSLLDWIFPKRCVCGALGSYLCLRCISQIGQAELICPVCERPSLGGATHPLCHRRYGLDGLWSLGVYQDPLRQLVQKLKYRFVTGLAKQLVDLMVEYWAKYDPYFINQIKKDRGEGWIVVPVPLHPRRENWRGFNQSALLGKMIAQNIGLDYSEALKRVKNTKPQMKLLASERKKNIRGAFVLPTSYQLPVANYLLIDDVWTTGSTLKECGYVLKRGGAKTVWAITIAR